MKRLTPELHSSETRLWQTVLLFAVQEYQQGDKAAKCWLFSGSDRLKLACEFAGVDHEASSKRIRKLSTKITVLPEVAPDGDVEAVGHRDRSTSKTRRVFDAVVDGASTSIDVAHKTGLTRKECSAYLSALRAQRKIERVGERIYGHSSVPVVVFQPVGVSQ